MQERIKKSCNARPSVAKHPVARRIHYRGISSLSLANLVYRVVVDRSHSSAISRTYISYWQKLVCYFWRAMGDDHLKVKDKQLFHPTER